MVREKAYFPGDILPVHRCSAYPCPDELPDGTLVRIIERNHQDSNRDLVEFAGRQYLVHERCIEKGLEPIAPRQPTVNPLDKSDTRFYQNLVCANYEFKCLGSTGKFEVSIRHPGGKTVVGITDTPELYPRRFSEVPRAAGRLEHAPQMYPGYAGPVIRVRDGQPETAALHWGFTPHWANKPIQNAQREKLTVSATWKGSFQTRRCLAPANAFFEWQARPGVKGKTRLRIHPVDLEVFCFAGLWQAFKGKDGQAIDCYTIVTTTPNEFMRAIHNRMPVILGPEAQERWMDTTNTTGEGLDELLGPYDGKLEAEPAL